MKADPTHLINQQIIGSRCLSDPAEYANGVPHKEFARVRKQGSICWVDETPLWLHDSAGGLITKGTGYWAVTRYAAIESISRQPEVFSSAVRGAFLADPKSRHDLERTRQLLINMDAPEHGLLRKFVTAAFTPRAVRELRGNIAAHARAIVDRALSMDQFDAVLDLAAELPLLVLADLLGMPREDRSLMFQWSNNLVGFDDADYGGGDLTRYENTFTEAFEYATQLASHKRRRPADDLVSHVINTTIEGRRLTPSEFSHLWLLLVVGGNESTRHLLSGSLRALTEWPEQREYLLMDPDLTATAVEELLRWVSPIMQFRRTAIRDIDLDGQRIHEGDKAILYYISANRDEAVFESADQLWLARSPNPHLSFGVGPHFCLGAHLARVEAITLLDVLRPYLRRFELTGPVVRLKSNFMNGIKSMPARFTG